MSLCAEPDHSFLEDIRFIRSKKIRLPHDPICLHEWTLVIWCHGMTHELSSINSEHASTPHFNPGTLNWIKSVYLLFFLMHLNIWFYRKYHKIIRCHPNANIKMINVDICLCSGRTLNRFFFFISNAWTSPQQISSLILELRVFIFPR